MTCQKERDVKISRRDLIKVTGASIIVTGAGGCSFLVTEEIPMPTSMGVPTDSPVPTGTPAPTDTAESGQNLMPGKEDGTWGFYGYSERALDRDKFDEFKTRFYELQGWDAATGYPTRAALESLGLGHVADELEGGGKLGDNS